MDRRKRQRLYDICYRSKRGDALTPDETDFIQEMFKKCRKTYAKIHQKAASAAVEDARRFP